MSKFNSWMKVFALFLFAAAAVVPLSAQTLTTLHSFELSDSYFPYAGVIQGTDGYFFGAGSDGGSVGGGSIFKMTPGGALTPIYSFPVGSNPARDLVQGADGDFYGATADGGANGDGTIYKITAGGGQTTLHTFDSTTVRTRTVPSSRPATAIFTGQLRPVGRTAMARSLKLPRVAR